jgi:hypothetical protein
MANGKQCNGYLEQATKRCVFNQGIQSYLDAPEQNGIERATSIIRGLQAGPGRQR